MKVWIFSFISFVLGLTVAGILWLIYIVDNGKMSILTEMQGYSLALELTDKNEIDVLQRASCNVLGIGLDNYKELDSSFISISGGHLIDSINDGFLSKVEAQLNGDLCKTPNK